MTLKFPIINFDPSSECKRFPLNSKIRNSKFETYCRLTTGNWRFARGFTLVELLVYMGLMSIFLLVLLDIFSVTLNTKLSSQSTASIAADSRYVLSKLSYDINNADSVTDPILGESTSRLQIVNSGITETYSLSSGNLVKTIGGVSSRLNGLDTSFDSITFKNIGNFGGKPTIQVAYKIKSNITLQGNRIQTQEINTTIGTR